MALSAQTVWEVRTLGNDTNGGAFVAGASGTDSSQQNAKNTVGSNISTTDAVAVGTTTITSATAAFTAAIVGNIVYFTGGTGAITAQRRQVTAFTNATTITIDASIAASTGMTMNIGGAIATFAELSSTRGMIASNKAFIKADGTYTPAAFTFTPTVTPNATNMYSQIQGYTTTRSDNGRPQVTFSIVSGPGVTFSGSGWRISNLLINANGMNNNSINCTGNFISINNVKLSNYAGFGITMNNTQSHIFRCEVTGGLAGSVGIFAPPGGSVTYSTVHDGVGVGIGGGGVGVTVAENLIYNQSGATSDGFQLTQQSTIINNTIYNIGRHGFSGTNTNNFCHTLINNIFAKCGGFGIQLASAAGSPAQMEYDGNAFFSNTSGNRNNMDDTGTVNALNAAGTYTNVNDIICTADPFVNAASGDFRLNQNPTAGAAIRGLGAYQLPPGSTSPANKGFSDMGAVQHQDPGFAA